MEKKKRKSLGIEISDISLDSGPEARVEPTLEPVSSTLANRAQVYQALLENTCSSVAGKVKLLEDITHQLNYIFTLMDETNPNIHPIKYHILNNWKIKIREVQDQVNELFVDLTSALSPYTQESTPVEVTSNGDHTH